MLVELARAQKAVWQERFASKREAGGRLREYKQLRTRLTGAVELSFAPESSGSKALDRMIDGFR